MFKMGHYYSPCAKQADWYVHVETQPEEQFLGILEQSPVTSNPWNVNLGIPV